MTYIELVSVIPIMWLLVISSIQTIETSCIIYGSSADKLYTDAIYYSDCQLTEFVIKNGGAKYYNETNNIFECMIKKGFGFRQVTVLNKTRNTNANIIDKIAFFLVFIPCLVVSIHIITLLVKDEYYYLNKKTHYYYYF